MTMRLRRAALAATLSVLAISTAGPAVTQSRATASVPPSAAELARARPPIIPGAHFHHVRLNVVNREASIAYYTKHFKAQRARFAGIEDAVWTQRSWILFNVVPQTPPNSTGTAIQHIGWGAVDAQKEFQRQQELGAQFQTRLSDISTSLGGGRAGRFFFMYLRGPDGEIIEINTDPDDNFGHIHLYSADSIAASRWYDAMFGTEPSPPYFDELVVQTGSGRQARDFFDNVLMIIIPAREGAELKSTRGTVVNSIGVSVPHLDTAMAAIRAKRITVLEEPSDGPNKAYRRALIEGPDKMAIELIEDKNPHPPITG